MMTEQDFQKLYCLGCTDCNATTEELRNCILSKDIREVVQMVAWRECIKNNLLNLVEIKPITENKNGIY